MERPILPRGFAAELSLNDVEELIDQHRGHLLQLKAAWPGVTNLQTRTAVGRKVADTERLVARLERVLAEREAEDDGEAAAQLRFLARSGRDQYSRSIAGSVLRVIEGGR